MSTDTPVGGPAPYQVGPWLVLPDRAELQRGDAVVRLEPRTLAVLQVLAAARGRTVSRQELVREVWNGRLVSDDAVHRQIAKLRAALGEAANGVETLPKLGFRLALPVLERERVPVRPDRPAALRRRSLVVSGAVALLLAIGLLLARMYSAGEPPRSSSVAPLTATDGLEILPAISPSGDAVAYAARSGDTHGFDLHVTALDADRGKRLTDLPGNELWPAWAPDGERIAFVHLSPAGCEVRIVSSEGGESHRLASCRDARGLAWTASGEGLLVSDREAESLPPRVRLIDIASGVSRTLTNPPVVSLGNSAPAPTPDGRGVVFVRNLALGVSELYRWTPDGETRLTADGLKVHGFAWHPDGKRLIVASNRDGGTFRLWRFDLATRGWSPIALTSPADSPALSRDGALLVYEHWDSNVRLHEQPLGRGEARSLQGSTRWDWSPARNPRDGRLAYLSDRSGAAEVWLAAANGSAPRRLTDFRGPFVQAPSWSPAGDRLAFAVSRNGQYDVFEIEPATRRTRPLTETARDETAPTYSSDGARVYFAAREGERWDLLTLDRTSGATHLVRRGVRRALEDPKGQWLYYTEAQRGGLWRTPVGEAEGAAERLADLAPVDEHNWFVDAGAVLFVVRDAQDEAVLARLDTRSGKIEMQHQLTGLIPTSGLAPSADRLAVVYAREARKNADLVRITDPLL